MTRNRNAMFIVLASVLTVVNSFLFVGAKRHQQCFGGDSSRQERGGGCNAAIKATDLNTGAVRSVRAIRRAFPFSQVNPGTYRIEVHAQGFGPAQSEPTMSRWADGFSDFSLSPAAAEQTVEVEAQVGLMSLENPNTSTSSKPRPSEPAQPRPGPDLCRSVCPGV